MNRSKGLVALLLFGIVTACSGRGEPAPSPTPSPVPSPSPGSELSVPQLKVALIERFGGLWYCDPDFYPIAHEDEQVLAIQRWDEVKADAEGFAAVLEQVDLHAGADFTDAEKLAIYRAWKVLNAIALESIGGERYRFDYLAQPAGGAAQGTRSAGTIAADGTIAVENQAPAGEPMCPICLARGTLIETPHGAVAVEDLRIGDAVWTLDATGLRIEGAVTAFGSTPAPRAHVVVRLILADGRSVTASPGHPLADGRRIGSVRAGDAVGGSTVLSAERVAYRGGSTFDVAVSGPTGLYVVNGIALRSTLTP
ncbi:MAG TPA: Hint domain-containing protein [Candidatus Polarisedimenticolia bacterium]|nr:Hint domain-containing protein [Candidatus Polarisedimenticolia bacterium]